MAETAEGASRLGLENFFWASLREMSAIWFLCVENLGEPGVLGVVSKELTFFRERLKAGDPSPPSLPPTKSPKETPLCVRRASTPPAPGPPGEGAPLREGGGALLGGGALRSAEELELWEGSED